MRHFPVGDAAFGFVLDPAGANGLSRVQAVAAVIQAAGIPGVVDVVAAPERVAVGYDPLAVGSVAEFEAAVAAAAATATAETVGPSTTHELPVVYDGPDLDDLCTAHGLSREVVVSLHTGPLYTVEAVGFTPGFAYLGGLPEQLVTPRRATPRPRVPAGSVGIGGSQTGVYPFASPGGWNLIGRSAVRLFDVACPRPAMLAVGDRVRFKEVAADDLAAGKVFDAPGAGSGDSRPENLAGPAAITILQPGLFTTVQDLGRPGYRASGLPLSGAADRVSLALANALVGNPAEAAVLECTLLGPTLRFEQPATVALVGGVFPGLPHGEAVSVSAGTEIALGHVTHGCRGYLAVAGGVAVVPVLKSRSTFVPASLGGFAGRPLRAGDQLAAGEAEAAPRRALVVPPALDSARRPRVLRVIPGEHVEHFDESAWGHTFRVSNRSNRMGLGLEGQPLAAADDGGSGRRGPVAAGGMRSIPVFPGTVQVPPDGNPIVLLADAQTIGGYPVFGHVITADLPIAAQLRPGDEVCWRPVSLTEAHAALREQQAAVTGFGSRA